MLGLEKIYFKQRKKMSKKYLLIDDSRLALSQIEKLIKELISEPEINKFQSVQDAIVFFEKTDPKEITFIFIDYNLEGMNGIELAKIFLKEIEPKRICLVTANTQESVVSGVNNIGIHFCSKSDLKNKISTIIEK